MSDNISVTPEQKIMILKLDAQVNLCEAKLMEAQLNRFNYLREQDLITENV